MNRPHAYFARFFQPHQESSMTSLRFIPLALALSGASLLVACNTAPMMPMGNAQAGAMAGHQSMAAMDMQMKTMREMHEKMMGAKTPQERSALMAEHMKAMQGGMAMMGGMGGMGDMQGMPKMQGMSAEMGAHHAMMAKRMEMMQTMMKMMMDRMPDATSR